MAGRQAKTSSVGGSRQLPRRGSRKCGLSIKRLFGKKCLNVVRLPLIRPKLRFVHLPPKGKACKDLFSRQKPTASPTGKPRTRLAKTSIVCLRRHFPCYRRFFRTFLSQEKKRKRGKQERIPAQRNRRSLPKGESKNAG